MYMDKDKSYVSKLFISVIWLDPLDYFLKADFETFPRTWSLFHIYNTVWNTSNEDKSA